MFFIFDNLYYNKIIIRGNMKKIIVKLENFQKSFGTKKIIDNINLEIYEKEFVTILGSSGCGKTTILRIIAGLDMPTSGKVYLDSVDVTALDPTKREVNTIFQNYALFPLMSVYDNIAFGLKMKKVPKDEIKKRVQKMLELVHLEGYEKRKPKDLSGGEQQRVAIARGLINNPKVLLLDEPLSALDLKLRKQMQVELKSLQKKLGITFIYVTHSQDEALSMSDRIVVLKDGKIEQVGSPVEVYENPKSLYVADFLGEANIFKGKVVEVLDSKCKVLIQNNLEFYVFNKNYQIGDYLSIIVRPENMKISKTSRKMNCLEGRILEEIYTGSVTLILVEVMKWQIKVIISGNDKLYKVGDLVYLYFTIEDSIVLRGNHEK